MRHARTRPCRIVRAAMALCAATGCVSVVRGEVTLLTGKSRIVKQFDFYEPGNFEKTPMHWVKRTRLDWRNEAKDPRFPHFLSGGFDRKEGYGDAPSFKLSLNGGSVSYQYHNTDVPTVAGCKYRIIGHVRPERLKHARAYITSYYLNRYGYPIDSESRRSNLLGPADNGDWHRLVLDLEEPPEEARFVGLSIWMTQPVVWLGPDASGAEAAREDAYAEAWFDDIGVYRLPRVKMRMDRASRLYQAGNDPVLQYLVRDPDPVGLSIDLSVSDSRGQLVKTIPIPPDNISGKDRSAFRDAPLGDLAVGLYRVKLEVRADNKPMLTLRDQFLKLGAPPCDSPASGRRFGVAMAQEDLDHAASCMEYLEAIGVMRAKLPLWRHASTKEEIKHGHPSTKELLGSLASRGAQVTGVLATMPDWMAKEAGVAPGQLFEAFGRSNKKLAAAFSYTAAHYAGAIDFWQLGQDSRSATAGQIDASASQAIEACRKLLGNLEGKIALALPHSMINVVENEIPAEAVSLHVPTLIRAQAIPAYLENFVAKKGQLRWIVLEGAARPRADYLADLTKRMVLARFSAPDAIYVPRSWQLLTNEDGTSHLVPDLQMAVVRNGVHMLDDAMRLTAVPLGIEVEGYLFRGHRDGLLALWSNVASQEPISRMLYLGDNCKLVDIWGSARPLAPDGDGRVEVLIGPEPVFVTGVDAAITALWASFTLSPTRIDTRRRPQRIKVGLTNPFDQPIKGELELEVPAHWSVTPATLPIALGPGEKWSRPVDIKTPVTAMAGPQQITGLLKLTVPGKYEIPQSAPLTLGCKGLRMRITGKREGDDFIGRVTVTNKTNALVTAKICVRPPGRPQMPGTIGYLQPGKSTVRQFVIKDCATLVGQPVRVQLQAGDRFLNKEAIIW